MIVISGGGTGGHLAIVKSLCEELNLRDQKPIFIGSTRGQDKLWFENDENFSERIFLESSGVVNKRGFDKILSLLNIFKLSLKCCKILKKHKARAVIIVGGYSAAPAAFAAVMCKIPLFIHEQNAITGKLNKLLKPYAKGYYSSYDKISPCNYPVGSKFFVTSRIRKELKTVIFLGGSQGARAINDLAVNLAPKLKESGIKIIHQCGKNALVKLEERYRNLGISLENDVEIFEFSKNLEQKMSIADLAISRAGASSLWELCANALPAIFIPYPHAAKNHQYYNAKFLFEKNIAKICLQNDSGVDTDSVLKMIKEFDINHSSKALQSMINQNGAKEIVDKIFSKLG
ncbi:MULTISPECIES: undecaprenyldiphospho-muramoylpentapeptide beta-N-acetylglucosaminyltransferase [Campylobacter]|uniref:undecaprenyldiphospho-muramoylpentapeptide beta-N-acetylglucosaminyltransferase n=1 Tax=Campylobacter TaxID=194 RepID=UPI0014752600|nr:MULTISPECIES: undecaprenyldiphospho-muramoylpentapeptide beta-N-acetylglucosaminyltransferase [unclassified Campylobacter]MBE3609218.1 undecaprenyldiphospho-muramoylpentapeptide beta-N-acetylglucosaminyltransferase [Campylobacter sp. RM12916]